MTPDTQDNHTPEAAAGVSARAMPGDGMLHPVGWASVLGLALNDHWGKGHLPPLLAGKLSDIAGMLFFPLFLVALWELARSLGARAPFAPSRRAVWLSGAATGVAFALVKTTAAGHDLYAVSMGAAQWLPRALWSVCVSAPTPVFQRVSCVRDATDLLSLLALPVPLAVGLQRAQFRTLTRGSQAV